MKYSRFIKTLVDGSVDAKLDGYDLKDALDSRDIGSDIVRRTLAKAVCDMRFQGTVRAAESWRNAARGQLEDFAQALMTAPDLDGKDAEKRLDEFLSDYFFNAVMNVQDKPGPLPAGTEEEEEGEMEGGKGLDAMSEAYREMQGGRDDDGQPDDSPKGGRGALSREAEQRVQTRFLRSIPDSLVRLAKLIGRSGQSEISSSGRFLTAAKSDIAGITVGNDLNCLLPSEIALLACPSTQDIFYRNYVEKRLQVFASASSSGTVTSTAARQDGPVIICLDTSGSMTGEPAEVARALTMAVTIVAQRRGRKVLVVKYADSHNFMAVKNLRKQRRSLLDYLSIYSGGGNNEDSMFYWLFSEVLPREAADFSSADVLCVSDFFWAGISDEVFGMITENKEKGMKFYGLKVREDSPGLDLNLAMGMGLNLGMPPGYHAPSEIIDSPWVWRQSACCCVEVSQKAEKSRNFSTK